MSIYQINIENIKGEFVKLDKYQGKVILIVNTASKCGYTKQYAGLQNLYAKYHDQGLEILDFPSNQFAAQAPGTNEQLATFCQINFNTKFETFAKIKVNGPNASPLYKYLKSGLPGIDPVNIRWNFTKFLVDRQGIVVARFDSKVTPEQLVPYIERLL